MKHYIFLPISIIIILGSGYYIQSSPSIIGAWLPYWRSEQAIESARQHIEYFNQLSPFSYEVKNDGSLIDPFRRNKARWTNFFDYARSRNIQLIPTIFWTTSSAMHTMLSDATNRNQHIDAIVNKVITDNMQGININYERVPTQDREHFLEFIKTLSNKLHAHGRLLCCSVGGRVADNCLSVFKDSTPVTRLKKSAPAVSLNPGNPITAEAYKKTLATYCDQIHLMGYDEWGMPFLHNPAYLKNSYYISHASDQWIEAIIQYALTYIPAHKLVVGIGTYGLEFTIFHRKHSIGFKKARNITYPRALELCSKHDTIPQRTGGGELSFTYLHENNLRYVCFLDAQAIKNKLALARKYNLGGIYIFKVDGEEDPAMWNVLDQAKSEPSGKQFTLVLDPGHSGIYAQSHTEPGYLLEKQINLAVAHELAGQLSNHAVNVILTRSEKTDFNSYLRKDMSDRLAIAHNCKADLFLSIVCSSPQEHTQKHAVCLPKTLLFNSSAYRMAFAFNHALQHTARLWQHHKQTCIITSTGTKQAHLYALHTAALPTLLLELMCNSQTAQNLDNFLSPAYRSKICKLITPAILDYINNHR